MGKRTKLREAQRRAEEQALAAHLQRNCKARSGPAFITAYAEFDPSYRDKIETYRNYWLRSPNDWRCQLRVRCPELRFLELVRFTFARFPVAPHLENTWTGDVPAAANLNDIHSLDFRLWYIVAAQGGSLHKSAAHEFLSKTETHHFLTAPVDITDTRRAFWYAVARAETDHERLAVRVSKSKITALDIADAYWKDAARFFARQPAPLPEMNDLIDYLQAIRAVDGGFSLAGRTLPALRRRMEEWHHTLRMAQVTCGERWTGRPTPNAAYDIDGARWRFKQIKNGWRLFEEGERMRHCVVAYKGACKEGDVSIWSLTCEVAGALHRCATIEVAGDGEITQIRGFANGCASRAELDIIERWASEHGLLFDELFIDP